MKCKLDAIIMNFIRKSVISGFFYGLLALFITSLGAANQENQISVQISAVALDRGIQGLEFFNSGDIDEIDIFRSSRSRLIRYEGPPELVFFREVETSEGEKIRQPVGSVTLNEATGRYLLFFVRHPGDEERYRIISLPDSLSSFRPGSFRFVNLAPFRIAVQLGEERFVLTERDFRDVRGRFEHGNYYRTVMVSLLDDADPFIAYSGRIFFSEALRMMYIIFPVPDGNPGQVRFVAIPDAVRTDSQ